MVTALKLVPIVLAFAAFVISCLTYYYSVARGGRIVLRKLKSSFSRSTGNANGAPTAGIAGVKVGFVNTGAKIAGMERPICKAIVEPEDAGFRIAVASPTLVGLDQPDELKEGIIWFSPYSMRVVAVIFWLKFPETHSLTCEQLAQQIRLQRIKLTVKLQVYEGISVRQRGVTVDITKDIADGIMVRKESRRCTDILRHVTKSLDIIIAGTLRRVNTGRFRGRGRRHSQR